MQRSSMYKNKISSIFLIIICLFSVLFFNCSAPRTINHKLYKYDQSYQPTVYASHAGVSSIHPLSSKVGLYILQKGGNAIDAAIAMQLALAVVYPEAGNIGGGGFMTMRLNDGTTRTLDFRETAPAAASRDMYLDQKGEVNFSKSTSGHLAVGVPGTIAGIFESMQYAKLPFKELIQPAIDLAEGYSYMVDPVRINTSINTMPSALDGHISFKKGDVFRQPELAATLKRIRDRGRKEFYEGKTARLIVEEMKRGSGIITMNDLKNYKAKWRKPLVFDYRGHTIITMPLPSSGGVLINQMLKMIEPYPMSSYERGSTASLNIMIEAARRAYRDRAIYLGDADFVNVPVERLVSTQYLESQMKDFIPGQSGISRPINLPITKQESHQTTHLSVVDKDGNAVSVTTTLNMPYGCGVVVGGAGFLLNNEMDDFAKKPGARSASGGVGGTNNLIEPSKRMLSSMSPTIVIKDNHLVMVLGTPGGTTIPSAVFQTIVNVVDYNMNAGDAVHAAKFHHEWMPDQVSVGKFPIDTITVLRKMGYKINEGFDSYLEVIKVNKDKTLEIVSERGDAEGY